MTDGKHGALFFFSSCTFVSYVSSLLGLMVNGLYLLGKLAWSHRPLRVNSECQISTSYGNAHDISPYTEIFKVTAEVRLKWEGWAHAADLGGLDVDELVVGGDNWG